MFLADPESMASNSGSDPYIEYEQLKKELGLAMEEWEAAHEESDKWQVDMLQKTGG